MVSSGETKCRLLEKPLSIGNSGTVWQRKRYHKITAKTDKQFRNVSDYKQPFEPDEPEPTTVPIVTGFGSQCYANDGSRWGIERSLDKDAATIFHSSAAKNGWAIYYIPPSHVTQVRILNRADCCGTFQTKRMLFEKELVIQMSFNETFMIISLKVKE